MVEFNNHCKEGFWLHGEIWGLGDSPTIGVLLEETEKTDGFDEIKAPTISYEDMSYSFEKKHRKIRVYKQLNARLTLGDFFAKLKLNFGEF